jgi:hypothetical protein
MTIANSAAPLELLTEMSPVDVLEMASAESVSMLT